MHPSTRKYRPLPWDNFCASMLSMEVPIHIIRLSPETSQLGVAVPIGGYDLAYLGVVIQSQPHCSAWYVFNARLSSLAFVDRAELERRQIDSQTPWLLTLPYVPDVPGRWEAAIPAQSLQYVINIDQESGLPRDRLFSTAMALRQVFVRLTSDQDENIRTLAEECRRCWDSLDARFSITR